MIHAKPSPPPKKGKDETPTKGLDSRIIVVKKKESHSPDTLVCYADALF